MSINIHKYYSGIALAVACRATCPRAHVGAVLISSRGEIISSGYNGAPRKMLHCNETGCILVNEKCVRTVHAELNCLLRASTIEGCTMYVTHLPCYNCCNAIINVGVIGVYYIQEYEDALQYEFQVSQQDLLRSSGVIIEKVVW